METKGRIVKIKGKVQHYQWGGADYIPALLGINNSEKRPFAEYWLGAHVNAPAVTEDDITLDALFTKTPAHLGMGVQQQFGRLPYLLKILDVREMLSIQVHPSKAAAVEEFAKENASGKPLQAPDRNYKDDNHKPELMMALGDFWLLHGFQSPALLIQTLHAEPALAFLVPLFEKDGYKGLYEHVMTMPQQEVNRILQPLLNRIVPAYRQGKLGKSTPDFWAARAALTYNNGTDIDRGIFSIYLFNIVQLKRGEAVFQDAGILHAYLEGQNVEIMANSDNVLRGGLTPKHIDVAELMKHVLFEPVVPHIIHGRPENAHEKVFPTPAPDFELRAIHLAPGDDYQVQAHAADIFIVLDGQVQVTEHETVFGLSKGEAFLATSGTACWLQSNAGAELYRATVPV